MRNAPLPPNHKGQDKNKLIKVKPEKWFFGLILVSIWKGKNELAAFVVSKEVWQDNEQLLEIVNSVLLDTINKTGQWK
jgi:hypothetical protein